jgi:hypothetical protein
MNALFSNTKHQLTFEQQKLLLQQQLLLQASLNQLVMRNSSMRADENNNKSIRNSLISKHGHYSMSKDGLVKEKKSSKRVLNENDISKKAFRSYDGLFIYFIFYCFVNII